MDFITRNHKVAISEPLKTPVHIFMTLQIHHSSIACPEQLFHYHIETDKGESLQTPSNKVCCMKTVDVSFECHGQCALFQIMAYVAPNMRYITIWTNDGLICWYIHVTQPPWVYNLHNRFQLASLLVCYHSSNMYWEFKEWRLSMKFQDM